MSKSEAFEKYPILKIATVHELVSMLQGCMEINDTEFAEAITAVLKETKGQS